MHNYADEVLFVETAKAEQRIQRSQPATLNHRFSRPGNSTSTGRPVLRARWVLVDETLQLIWSEDHEEPLKRVA
jgi:molybdopterin biosynthesis enzyme